MIYKAIEMIYKFLRILLSALIVMLFVAIIAVNLKMNYSPQIKVVNLDTINYDLLMELRGLKHALDNNADIDMQKIYPEGYLFINALYGLAWCNVIGSCENKPCPYLNEGHSEIQNAWNKINSDIGRYSFTAELPLAYGAFYSGWSTYLLGKKLSIEQLAKRDTSEIEQFKKQCELIEASIKEKIYPLSYYGGAWPADAVVCVAALSLHDKLFPPKYATSIKAWIDKVKTKVDANGLIPHAVNPLNDLATEAARGSSQSLMLIFLKDIDEGFARDQFKIYKDNFLSHKLGLTGLREYLKGEYGTGDIDSGPVIFQMGSAATIVGMHTMHLYGERTTATEIRNMIEALGFPLKDNERKTYLLGLLPMADAFIVWGHSEIKVSETKTDFTLFHIYSSMLILVLCLTLWLLLKSKQSASE